MELCSPIELLKGTPSARLWAEQRPPLLKPLCKRWWVDETAPCVRFTVFCENNDLRVSVGLLECTECFLFLSPCVVFLIIIVFDTILTLYMCFCLYKIFEWMQNTFVIFSWILYMNYSINVENRLMWWLIDPAHVRRCVSWNNADVWVFVVAFLQTGSYILFLCLSCFSMAACSIRPGPAFQILTVCLWKHTERQKQRRPRRAFGVLKDTSALGVLPHPGYLLSLQRRQLLIQPNDRRCWRRPYMKKAAEMVCLNGFQMFCRLVVENRMCFGLGLDRSRPV